jgi:hypothetical protein
MKRKPLLHAGVFNDEAFAGEYVRRNWRLAVGFGDLQVRLAE